MINHVNKPLPPIFCLNLARRPDRRLHAWSAFRKEGLLVNRIVAPDAISITEKRGHRSSGLRACGLAHRMAWRQGRKNGASQVLVFEDDVVLCNGFRRRLESTMNLLPNDWMVLYLGCVFRTPPEPITTGLLRVTGLTWDMHAYVIRRPLWEIASREMAGTSCRSRISLEDNVDADKKSPKTRGRARFDSACDVILADYHKQFAAYAVWPPMAWQVNGLSNNENAIRGNYRPDGTQDLYRDVIKDLPRVVNGESFKEIGNTAHIGGLPKNHSADEVDTQAPRPTPVKAASNVLKHEEPTVEGFEDGLTVPFNAVAYTTQAEPIKLLTSTHQNGRGILLSPYSVRTELMAWRMAESLRKHSPSVPVYIYAQDYIPTMPWRGHATVKVARGWHTGKDDLRWVNKLEALKNSIFEETLFFDCDMLALGPIHDWFKLLGKDDLGFWMMERGVAGYPDRMEFNLLNPHVFCPHYGVNAVPTMVGGGHYFMRKSGRSEKLLRRIAEIMVDATEDSTALYWKFAGVGNIIGDEPAASMVAVEEGMRLAFADVGKNSPVGCFMPPWQSWVQTDPSNGVMSYDCQWTGCTVSPVVIHFAGNGKDDPVYQKWIESADEKISELNS